MLNLDKQTALLPMSGGERLGERLRAILIVTLLLILGLFWHHKALAPISPPAPPQAEIGGEEEGVVTTLLAVGDILLSRHVGQKIDAANDPNLPFANLKELLSSADLTFGNLECPLSDSNVPEREGLIFRCLTKYVPGLVTAGFDVLSTANNHALDQGSDAVGFTRDYLLSQNILPVGAGRNQEEAWTPAIISPPSAEGREEETQEGVKVAFLAASYASRNDGGKSRNDYVARIEDLDILQSAIFNLKSQNYFVIVSMHAGTEYTRKPQEEQVAFAHAAIDAGADIVIGHHPHWIQPVEIYPPISPPAPPQAGIGGEEEGVHRGLIFHSLGNFIFDQSWSQETKEGLAIKLNIKNQKSNTYLESAELIPIIIESNCCPRLATEEEKTAILKKINLGSDTIELSPP